MFPGPWKAKCKAKQLRFQWQCSKPAGARGHGALIDLEEVDSPCSWDFKLETLCVPPSRVLFPTWDLLFVLLWLKLNKLMQILPATDLRIQEVKTMGKENSVIVLHWPGLMEVMFLLVQWVKLGLKGKIPFSWMGKLSPEVSLASLCLRFRNTLLSRIFLVPLIYWSAILLIFCLGWAALNTSKHYSVLERVTVFAAGVQTSLHLLHFECHH